MATWRRVYLPPVLASMLAASATPALALQTIEARDGVSVEAAISLREATRIKVDGERITDVFGNVHASNCGAGAAVSPQGPPASSVNLTAEIVLECDRDKGEIYVKPIAPGAKPVNLFVATAKATYTLVLKRVDMPAETIVLKDRAGPVALRPAEGAQGASPAHVRALKRMLTAMASERITSDMRVEEVNRPVQLWAECRFTLLRIYEGRGLVGERYLLTNLSNAPMVLAEQEFDREQGDVLGVAIEGHHLLPGESSAVFVLRQRS